MLHEDLLNSIDLNSAMVIIEISLVTGDKIKNQTQLKQVINHFSRFYSFYRNKKDTQKYLDLYVALIKNCLAPKIYPKEQLLDKIIYTFSHYRGFEDVTINFDGIYFANVNQGWIPEEKYFVKLIKDKIISYDCVKTILDMIPALSKELIFNCSDLFSPVFGKPSYKITSLNVLTSGYGKRYIKPEFTEIEHMEFLQKYLNLDSDLNKFYESIFTHISEYIIQSSTITKIYQQIIKQFRDKDLKISYKLFLLINSKLEFNNSNVKEYINLIEKLTQEQFMTFYSYHCYTFGVIFTELRNQNKIKLINNFEDLKPLLDSNTLLRTLDLFDIIYCGEKTSELLYYILQNKKKFISISTKEIEFIKKNIINNSIEIDDDLFLAFANADLSSLLEYCFENKYQLKNSIVLKMHSPKIYEQLIIANNYNYYVNDEVFNHITLLLFSVGKTVDDVCMLIKSCSIYKNDDDKDFIQKKEQIVTYYKSLNSYKTELSIYYNDKITPEMIVNADKPSVRYYLFNKYLEQQNTKSVNDIDKKVNEEKNVEKNEEKTVKRIVKKVVKKVVKKQVENVE